MKKSVYFIVLFSLSVMACSGQNKTKIHKDGTNAGYFVPDTAVAAFFGKTNSSCIFNADTGVVYSLVPLQKKTTQSLVYKGFVVDTSVVLSGKQLAALQFLMADSASIKKTPFVSKHVFEPDIAFEFKKDSVLVSVFFCFACNEIGVFENNVLKKAWFFRKDVFMRFCRLVFPKK